MLRARVVPCLLLRGRGLVKTRRFKDPVYIGDPVNAVRIFSEKEVDELVLLDIDASREQREPDYELIAEIAGECFMPVAYGGGVRTLDQVRRLIRSGVEKVVVNSAACQTTAVLRAAADVFGSQAVVGAVDVRKPAVRWHLGAGQPLQRVRSHAHSGRPARCMYHSVRIAVLAAARAALLYRPQPVVHGPQRRVSRQWHDVQP